MENTLNSATLIQVHTVKFYFGKFSSVQLGIKDSELDTVSHTLMDIPSFPSIVPWLGFTVRKVFLCIFSPFSTPHPKVISSAPPMVTFRTQVPKFWTEPQRILHMNYTGGSQYEKPASSFGSSGVSINRANIPLRSLAVEWVIPRTRYVWLTSHGNEIACSQASRNWSVCRAFRNRPMPHTCPWNLRWDESYILSNRRGYGKTGTPVAIISCMRPG